MKRLIGFVLRNISLVLVVAMALSSATTRGQVIYVSNINSNGNTGTIGEYTTSGGTVNASLVSGLNGPDGIAVSGPNLFVASGGKNGTIGEYTTAGAVVNASLVSGLSYPGGLVLSGSDLFVVNEGYGYTGGTIGEYTTSGAVVNASLVSVMSAPQDIAISGSDMFVTNLGGDAIGEYTTSGGTVNASLVFPLKYPGGLAISGSDLFVADFFDGTIGEYTTSGAVVNASLVSGLGLNSGYGLAISGSDMFVTNFNNGTIGEYTTAGAVVNASLISGLNKPFGITVVPEPSTLALLGVGALGLIAYVWRRRAKTMVRGLLAVALLASAVTAQADVFNMGGTISGGTWTGLASLQFVTVGNPGNVADPNTGSLYGSVPYVYRMGEYDVTVGQYCQFLNAVATKSDTYGLYNSFMATLMPTVAITQTAVVGVPGVSYSYSVTGGHNGTDSAGVNFPAFDVTWGDAARFCNWLQNGQPTSGTEASGTTETGAYSLNGATSNTTLMAVTRGSTANYVIPTENEWYKAAYYKSGGTNAGYWTYPTKNNTAPSNVLSATGTNNANFNSGIFQRPIDTDPTNNLTPVGLFTDSPGPYGTFDMGGDVYQWNEAVVDPSWRVLLGGGFDSILSGLASSNLQYEPPEDPFGDVGFRVASVGAVPEPGSIALLLAGAVAFGIWRRRRNA